MNDNKECSKFLYHLNLQQVTSKVPLHNLMLVEFMRVLGDIINQCK